MKKQKSVRSLLALSVILLALFASVFCTFDEDIIHSFEHEENVSANLDDFLARFAVAEEDGLDLGGEPFVLENSPAFALINGSLPAFGDENLHHRVAARSANSLDIRITFADVAMNTGTGFANPTNGAALRACVIQSFAYFNNMFDINPANVNKRWNVVITSSTTGQATSGKSFYDDATFSKSYAQRAIIDGEVINGNPDTVHSSINFNFAATFSSPVCSDPRSIINLPNAPTGQYDTIRFTFRAIVQSLGVFTNIKYAANNCPGANPFQSTTIQTVVGTCSPFVSHATSFDKDLGDKNGVSFFSGAPNDDIFTGPANAAISNSVTYRGPKTLAATEGKGVGMFSDTPYDPDLPNFYDTFGVRSSYQPFVSKVSFLREESYRTFAPAELAVLEDLGYSFDKDNNDECQFALPVGVGRTTFEIDDATASPFPPASCSSGFGKDLWFVFTAEKDGIYTFSTCESTFNTTVSVYPRCDVPNTSNDPGCAFNFCGNGRSTRTFSMSAGQIYFIRIGSPSGVTGTGVLDIIFTLRCDNNPYTAIIPPNAPFFPDGFANSLVAIRYTPCAPSYTLNTAVLRIFVDSTDGVQNGDTYSVFVWQNLRGNGNPLAGTMNLIYNVDSSINVGTTGNSILTHTFTPPLAISGGGDIYVGFVIRHNRGTRVGPAFRSTNSDSYRGFIYLPTSGSFPLGVDPLTQPVKYANVDAPSNFVLPSMQISTTATTPVPLPVLSITPDVIAVPETGSQFAIPFIRSGDVQNALTFTFEISGTAVYGTHYTISNIPGVKAGTNSLTIAQFRSSFLAGITPINDPANQIDRTIILTITPNPSAFSLDVSTHTITLTNNPPIVTFSLDTTTLLEGAGTATFTFSRVQTSTPVFVKIDVSGSATFGSDYSSSLLVPGQNTVVIPIGQASGSFTVTPRSDLLTGEPSETVVVSIIPDGSYVVAGGVSSQTLTITNRASGSGDPHMVGFHGQVFDYIGVAGQVVNMLTDPDLQVNSLLGLQKIGENSFFPGPVMMEMAFMTRSHTVTINAGGYLKEETGFVKVDGVLLPLGHSFLDGILSVSFSALSASSKDLGLYGDDYLVGQVNVKLEGMYEFTIFMIENGKDHLHHTKWVTNYPRRFLDFNASLLDLDRRPHGVLGQTAAPLGKERSVNEWTIEGKDEDYVVKDGLTGSQFSFNKF